MLYCVEEILKNEAFEKISLRVQHTKDLEYECEYKHVHVPPRRMKVSQNEC